MLNVLVFNKKYQSHSGSFYISHRIEVVILNILNPIYIGRFGLVR